MKTWLIGILCILAGCGSAPHQKKTDRLLEVNLGFDPQTLDPRKSRRLNDRILITMLFDGLTRQDPRGFPACALADQIEVSEDRKTYVFHLKKAYWTNGDPVTSEDFVYAWKTALSPRFPCENAYQMYCIRNAKAVKSGEMPLEDLGVRALDPLSLQVDLEEPTPYFLELLTFPVFFPVHQSADVSGADFVSCGPFSLAEWKHNDSIKIVKNRTYWDQETVRLSGVHFCMVPEDTELKMFENKELDWAGSPMSTLPTDAIAELKDQRILKDAPMLGTYFYRINTQSYPLSHPLIRRAFSLAVDRKAIVNHIIQGSQTPATGLVPAVMGVQQKPYFQDCHVEEARSLFAKALQELHLDKENFPVLTILYSSTQRNHLVAQAIQQQWQDILGAKVALEGLESKVFFDRLKQKDYQIASGSWIADFNDPINFLEIFKYRMDSTNNTNWENGVYRDLLSISNQVAIPEKRKELFRQCEQILIEEMPIIPLYHMAMNYVQNEHLKGVVVSPLGNIDFKWAYLSID